MTFWKRCDILICCIPKIIILKKFLVKSLYLVDFDMSVEDEKIVMPGDKIGIIEQYLPGEGTYDDNGDIKSSVLGNVKINQKMKVISVVSDAKPAILKVGDIVYGQITDIKPQRANVKIECIKDNARPLALPYMGAIHISQAKKDYLIWYYSTQEYGHWKRCSRCGEVKLAHNKFFSKNKTSKDGFYSICKECRNKKNKEDKKAE